MKNDERKKKKKKERKKKKNNNNNATKDIAFTALASSSSGTTLTFFVRTVSAGNNNSLSFYKHCIPHYQELSSFLRWLFLIIFVLYPLISVRLISEVTRECKAGKEMHNFQF